MLTDQELSRAPFPDLPVRLSQRRSKSRTEPVAPRSFSGLSIWPGFMSDAASFALSLDNTVRRNAVPLATIDALRPAADEIGVRVPLEAHIFPQTNRLATRLGLHFIYDQGGSNRSYSYTDLVILDTSQPHPAVGNRSELSNRIFGNGEAKGPWQWELTGNRDLVEAISVNEDQEKLVHVIQQVFGDMILDETRYGFISDYNQTVFFRRVSGRSKTLEFSPVVRADDAPIEKFLFVLHLAEIDKLMKPQFSRLLVEETPRVGYTVILPRLSIVTRSGRLSMCPMQSIRVGSTVGKRERIGKRQRKLAVAEDDICVPIYDEENFKKIPVANMKELGISGKVIGLGRYGNVVEAKVHKVNLALKLFDLRFEGAVTAFVREQSVYQRLLDLQGTHIPELLGVGRLPHCNVVFLALTDEGEHDVWKKLQGKGGKQVARQILAALDDIHSHGVLHNDLKLSNVMWRNGPKIIDFESCVLDGERECFHAETTEMEMLLSDALCEA